MKVSIIIPTKDRPDLLAVTLRYAEEAAQVIESEIIVVNDSRKNRPVIPTSAGVMLIQNAGAGVAAARNTGAKAAVGDLLLFMDDDILISPESMRHICEVHDVHESIGLNLNWEYPPAIRDALTRNQFGRFLSAGKMTTFKGWYADSSWADNALFKAKSVASFHLSLRREDFDRTKGYNELFPHSGFEDYDFPQRLKGAGIDFLIDSRVTVYHNELQNQSLADWLLRQERRATTRKVAVTLGYTELNLWFPIWKRLLFHLVGFSRSGIRWAMRLIPNKRLFDFFYFRLLAILQAESIFRGYDQMKGLGHESLDESKHA